MSILLGESYEIKKKKNCPVCSQNEFKEQEDKGYYKKGQGEKRVLALDQATYTSGWSIFF